MPRRDNSCSWIFSYHWGYSFSSLILMLWRIYQHIYLSYGRQHSMGSCESGKRWQLKGQFRLIRLRAWLHCCSAVEQMDWHGCRTPLWGLQWGKNIPHTSRRKDSKQASSISTCNNIRTKFSNKNVNCLVDQDNSLDTLRTTVSPCTCAE